MNPFLIAPLTFVAIFAATLLGMRLRASLPDHHLSDDTKDAVRIGMGLVATMAALILGLLVASAKGTYDTEKSEVTQMAAKVILLDQVLANYGPESQPTRQILRQAIEATLVRVWSVSEAGRAPADPTPLWGSTLPKAIQQLAPLDESQRTFKAQAAAMAVELGEMRWLLFEQTGSSIASPLLVVVVVWLAIIFGSVGLFAPWNSTTVIALMLAALAVSGSLFLILELDQPFGGLIQISSQPFIDARQHFNH